MQRCPGPGSTLLLKTLPGVEASAQAPGGRCVIVGLGASAGGLEAIRTLLDHMPSTEDMAFVYVPHLSASHQSLLPELLAQHTEMAVEQIRDGMRVEPNHFYVIAPGTGVTVQGGTLRTAPSGEHRPPSVIDEFFRSLAEDQGPHAVGVVLSGSGSDGALGVRAIKEHGGLALAQSPSTSRHEGMPLAAATAGMVDKVLDLEVIPEVLSDYVGFLRSLSACDGHEKLEGQVLELLPQISSLL